MIEDLWYRNAVIYSLDIDTFLDSNGDGIGDIEGLIERLNWTARMIRMRKECPEIGWGEWSIVDAGSPSVAAMRYRWRDALDYRWFRVGGLDYAVKRRREGAAVGRPARRTPQCRPGARPC
jgi:hypothetical protein